MFLSSSTIPRLPHDVLHQLFEFAACTDRRTALKLALVSRIIQPWIDEIIYSEVILHNKRVAHAFLRTVQFPRSKPQAFFSTAVKSLVICPDFEPTVVASLLSVCRGIVSLSYWPLPDTRGGLFETRDASHTFISSLTLRGLHQLYPRRLSVVLHEHHPIYLFQPIFDIPFFANVTHLSIVNSWEQWTAWAGNGISSASMPSLTHVKFDLAVGQTPSAKAQTRSNWLNTVTDSSSQSAYCSFSEQQLLSPWLIKMTRAADALSSILNNTRSIQVCILVLRFDSEPARTAKAISRLAFPKICSDMGIVHDGEGRGNEAGFDPRLVFAWEKEPFRYSYAHSAQEMMLWKSAGAVVKAQRSMSGYAVLNCDHLI